MNPLAIGAADSSPPWVFLYFFIKENALKCRRAFASQAVSSFLFLVCRVLGCADNAQVFSAVVHRVAVDMVNDVAILRGSNGAVQINCSVFPAADHIYANNVALVLAGRGPDVPRIQIEERCISRSSINTESPLAD